MSPRRTLPIRILATLPRALRSRTLLVAALALLVPAGARAQSDLCDDATAVPVPSQSFGTTVDAVSDGPGCAGTGSDAPGVWYRFAGTGGTVEASLCWPENQSYDTQLSVFTGSGCVALECVAGNDDACGLQSAVEVPTVAGATYWVLVHGFATASGEYRLTLADREPVPNDDCAAAIPVAVPSVTLGSTQGAAPDGVGCTGTNSVAPGVWYSLVGTGLPVEASLCWPEGATFDTQLSVYQGATCETLACVVGNDDDPACALQSRVEFPTEAGESYRILVHGFGGASGEFRLSITGERPGPALFRRGEIDQDGRVSITDAVAILGYLFRGVPGVVPDCLDAADVDDNGSIALTDAIVVFAYLFQRGAPPAAPGPNECGVDPSADPLGCERVDGCGVSEPGFARVDALRIDAGGGRSETAGGEPVTLEFDFSARNDAGCATCPRQIVVAVDDQVLCLYEGAPGADETLEITRTLEIDAPLTPGEYPVLALASELESCVAAVAAFRAEAARVIGTLAVVQGPPRIEVEAVRITGDTVSVSRFGDTVVPPGHTIQVEVDYAGLSSRRYPEDPQQLVVGIEDGVLGCAVSDVFPVYREAAPRRGTAVFTATVSDLPGSFRIFARSVRPQRIEESDCEGALQRYGNIAGLEQVAEFVVLQGAFVSSLSIDGAGAEASVAPGELVTYEAVYTAANDARCPDCIHQSALYLEPVLEDALLDDRALGCAFSGIPSVTPESGRTVFSAIAPQAAGTYRILQTQFFDVGVVGERGCEIAGRMIDDVRPETAYEVGLLTVAAGARATRITLESDDRSARTLDVDVDDESVVVVIDHFATNAPEAPGVRRAVALAVLFDGELVGAQIVYDGVPPVGDYDEGQSVLPLGGNLELGTFTFYSVEIVDGEEPTNAEVEASLEGVEPLATLVVGGVSVGRVTLGGQAAPAVVEVLGGEIVDVDVEYRARAQTGCANCARFVVLGLDGEPVACIDPGATPDGASRTWSGSITAPTTPGDYRLYTRTIRAGSCAVATERYRPTDRAVATLRVVAAVVPPALAPAAPAELPPEMMLDWDDLVSAGFVSTLQRALNSPGDELTIGIEFRAEASLFRVLSAGTTVNFDVGLLRNSENFYELSFSLSKANSAGVGLSSAVTANVATGVRGSIVFTVRRIEDIPTALRQFAIALVLKPAASLINDVIAGLNEAIAEIDMAITEVSRFLEDVALAIDTKNGCIADNPFLLIDLAGCQACVVQRLTSRLIVLNTIRAIEDSRRVANRDAIAQLDLSTAFFTDDNDALVKTTLEIELSASASLGAQLSPFPGISVQGATAGVSLTAMLGGALAIDLAPDGSLDAAVARVHGTVSVDPVLGTTRASGSLGVEIETIFDFDGASFVEVGAATVTMFLDAEVETGVGVAFAGIGRRYEVEIDLLQFRDEGTEFASFLSSGDPEELARALGDVEATFSVQDRRTLGARFGIDVSIEVLTVGFTGEVKWTDAGPLREASYTLGEGLALLFDPASVHAIQDALALQLD